MWILYAISAAALWGLNYSFSERILDSISPFTLLALEMLIGGVFFTFVSMFAHAKRDLHTLSNDPKLQLIVIAEIIIVLLANLLILLSVREKNATFAGIVELIYPFFTVFFTWLFFQKIHLNPSFLMGSLFVFLGVSIISFS